MVEVLTRAEIEAKYEGEWVFISDPEFDEQMRVVSGRVLVHSKDRDEFDRQTLALAPRPREGAFLYLGKMPEHILLVIIP